VIGLVDRLPHGVQATFWHPYELLEVAELKIDGFAEMVQRYDVVELNTAVKAFYFEHLYQRDSAVDTVIYLDPDILVCAPFNHLESVLREHHIIVTPHSCSIGNSTTALYYEQGMLGMGIYNLGFIATRRSKVTSAFLQWWQYRLREHCYRAPGDGIFVDQLWMTLAPLYFPVHVEKNLGYNMCYWNHYERRLSQNNGRYLVNGEQELIFYHFSSYDPEEPDKVTVRTKSLTNSFDERPDLKPIYDDYRTRLLANGYLSVKSIPYSLRRNPPKSELTPKTAVRDSIRGILRALPRSVQTPIKRVAQFTVNSFKSI
jgi:hypothetical protein